MDIVGSLRNLELTIDRPLDQESMADLIGLFRRYGIDLQGLRGFGDPVNDVWLKNPDAYWRRDMFQIDEGLALSQVNSWQMYRRCRG
jgi:hypothetical protein